MVYAHGTLCLHKSYGHERRAAPRRTVPTGTSGNIAPSENHRSYPSFLSTPANSFASNARNMQVETFASLPNRKTSAAAVVSSAASMIYAPSYGPVVQY